jgi:hypothetical protein
MYFDGLKDRRVSIFGSSADTALVLFFLALEFGTTINGFSVDAALMLMTMLMVIVLPFYLPSNSERPTFGKWLIGRGLIALCGTLLGIAFSTILPESLRFLPLSLLILLSFASCLIQFYGLMRLRLAN